MKECHALQKRAGASAHRTERLLDLLDGSLIPLVSRKPAGRAPSHSRHPRERGGVPIRVEIRSGSSGPLADALSRRTTIVDLSFRLVNAHSRIALAWSKYM